MSDGLAQNNVGEILIWRFGDDLPISPNLVHRQI